MSDGSYSILLTFLSLQTQYTVRNVGVFQFSTQNISWHRLCHRAFSEGKRKRNNIYCVRSMCMCAQYSQFHTFNTCTMCLVFWLVEVFVHPIFSPSSFNKWTKSCLCIHNHRYHQMAPFCIDFLHSFSFFVRFSSVRFNTFLWKWLLLLYFSFEKL